MAIMGLNLPTDIPWERVCVTEDMMAGAACELHHPPKWQSSIAVSRYVPDDEYQVYEGRKITYLKVTCSITGFQPRDKEVEGRINFGGIGVLQIPDVDSLLEQYLPCTGALIQVAVAPHPSFSGAPSAALDDFPYFMDFQPKKRELYEMVTETGERSSRSMEDLKVGKASGNSQSLEVLDIDQGGGSGGSAGVSYAGVGVSGSYQSSTQGQWGTKQLSNQELSVSRTTDESRERREGESHTTQLSQMYHLLDSYHMGTNRALFFVQPRPHILEVPTGFVRGPRGVDGIQEFFLVVNQPKDQDGFGVSVRLDTSHLTVVPIMDYDRSRSDTVQCKAVADIPTSADIPDARQTIGLQDSDGDRVGTAYYNCFKRDAHNSTPYAPPTDYRIDVDTDGGYLDQVNVAYHGTSNVFVDPGGNSLTITCDAESHVCKFEHSDIDVGYNDPDNIGDDTYKWTASAERDILVHLISREPTVKTGEKHVMLITTRELCCGDPSRFSRGAMVADVITLAGRGGQSLSIPARSFAAASSSLKRATIRGAEGAASSQARQPNLMSGADRRAATAGACGDQFYKDTCHGLSGGASELLVAKAGTPDHQSAAGIDPPGMTAREANELSITIREAMIRSVGSRRRESTKPLPYIDTELFHLQLRRQLVQTAAGRAVLSRPVGDLVSAETLRGLGKLSQSTEDQITCDRVAAQSAESIARATGLPLPAARDLKLACLGLPTNDAPAGHYNSPPE